MCLDCLLAKSHQYPFVFNQAQATKPLVLGVLTFGDWLPISLVMVLSIICLLLTNILDILDFFHLNSNLMSTMFSLLFDHILSTYLAQN